VQLNLPILDQLSNSQNIPIAGAGGGFDIFSGLPLFFALRDLGLADRWAAPRFAEHSAFEPRVCDDADATRRADEWTVLAGES
jgi:hypothetical protein